MRKNVLGGNLSVQNIDSYLQFQRDSELKGKRSAYVASLSGLDVPESLAGDIWDILSTFSDAQIADLRARVSAKKSNRR